VENLQFIINGLDAFIDLYQNAPDIVMDEMEIAVLESILYLEAQVKTTTPTGAYEKLRDSFTTEVKRDADEIVGVISTSLSYAIPVELGTKPHMPPVTPLIDWVKTKIGLDEDEGGKRIAWAIAIKISQRGTEGAHMVGDIWESPITEAMADSILQKYVNRIEARLNG